MNDTMIKCVQVEQAVPPPTPNPIPRPIAIAQPPQVVAPPNTINNNGPYGTCGNGNRGNGKCPNSLECCSQYGHCGTTPAHCDVDTNIGNVNNNVNVNTNNGGVAGTCGGGKVGNNICPNPMECCSDYGFCGSTPSHCDSQQQQAVQPIGQPSTSQQNTPQFNQQGVLVPVGSTRQNIPVHPARRLRRLTSLMSSDSILISLGLVVVGALFPITSVEDGMFG